MAAGTRDFTPSLGSQLRVLRQNSPPSSGMKAEFPNAAIPSATSCIPNHFLYHREFLSCLGTRLLSWVHHVCLEPTECFPQISVLYPVL